MPYDISACTGIVAATQPQQSKEHIDQQDNRERQHCQQHQAALQHFIERQTKEIIADIYLEEGVRQPKGTAVTKTKVGIPFRVDTSRKKQRDAGANRQNHQIQQLIR